jgi:hypothetical protein
MNIGNVLAASIAINSQKTAIARTGTRPIGGNPCSVVRPTGLPAGRQDCAVVAQLHRTGHGLLRLLSGRTDRRAGERLPAQGANREDTGPSPKSELPLCALAETCRA